MAKYKVAHDWIFTPDGQDNIAKDTVLTEEEIASRGLDRDALLDRGSIYALEGTGDVPPAAPPVDPEKGTDPVPPGTPGPREILTPAEYQARIDALQGQIAALQAAQSQQQSSDNADAFESDLTARLGGGPAATRAARNLIAAGYDSNEKIAGASGDDLREVNGVGPAMVDRLLSSE